jgi:hypothetical protein
MKRKLGGICIAPTHPFWAALGTESRVPYLGNTADRQPWSALTYRYISRSTAYQNEKLTHCHRWDSNLRSLATANQNEKLIHCHRWDSNLQSLAR